MMKTIEETLTAVSSELRELSLKIHGEQSLDGQVPALNLSRCWVDHPELGFQEKSVVSTHFPSTFPSTRFGCRYAHDVLTRFMSSKGWEITKHYLGLDTAWRAEFVVGVGGRTLGVNSEMDALPGIGHACGHNLIAIAGVGVALAVKAALEKHSVPGRVVLLGTPGASHFFGRFYCLRLTCACSAEEGGAGKIILIERGGYKDMDACVMYATTFF